MFIYYSSVTERNNEHIEWKRHSLLNCGNVTPRDTRLTVLTDTFAWVKREDADSSREQEEEREQVTQQQQQQQNISAAL